LCKETKVAKKSHFNGLNIKKFVVFHAILMPPVGDFHVSKGFLNLFHIYRTPSQLILAAEVGENLARFPPTDT
jgi:hypothetical protein